MKLKLIILALVLSTNIAKAQEHTHACAANKLKAIANAPKKSRATLNDAALMAKYDVKHYHLDVSAENNSLYIAGHTRITAVAVATIDTFVCELSTAHTIDSIVYNGVQLTKYHTNDVVYAILPTSINSGAYFSIKVYYKGTAPSTGASAIGYGYNTDTSPSWGNSVTWSLSQPYSAYQWFAAKQSLQDKADSSSVYITTNNQNKAGSNGLLVGIDSLANNKVKYKWHSSFAIDYYLISIAVARYIDYTNYAYPNNLPGDSIMVQNYVYNNPGTLPNFQNRIDTLPKMIELFSEKVSLYPFHKEKYGIALAPFSGGMEHQTMSSQGYYNFTLDAHELFHQWFGDHVTCKTWRDIWINEGFASYGEYIALEHLRSKAAAQADMLGVHNRVKGQLGGSIFFTDTTNARIFSSRLSYDKGAAIVHTLRFVLGDSIFYAVLNKFQQQYAFSTASIDDFKAVAETVSSKNLTAFFDQWIYKEGYVKYNAEYTSNGKAIIIKLTHSGSVASNNLYQTPLQILCKSSSGDTTITVQVSTNTEYYYIPSAKAISGLVIDPNNWLIDSVGSITTNADLLTNLHTANKQVVSLAPNPATNELQVSTGLAYNNYIIVDAVGKQVSNGIITTNNFVLNISNLQKGFYHLVLTTHNGVAVNKAFVKQ
jgi:aminopeptidase N